MGGVRVSVKVVRKVIGGRIANVVLLNESDLYIQTNVVEPTGPNGKERSRLKDEGEGEGELSHEEIC